MLYSPVCYSVYHSVLPLHGIVVQLACVTHAASVHPEPGSNSLFDSLIMPAGICFLFLQLCYTHRFSVIILTSGQDNCSQSKIVTKN